MYFHSLRGSYILSSENSAAIEGDALALGLATFCTQFIVNLYFLSDVLLTLGDLSSTFQNNQVNLLSIEGLVKDKLSALEELRKDVFKKGYMIILADDHPDALSTISKDEFELQAIQYLDRVISSITNRFPQVRLVTLLGYIHPQNASKATCTPALVMELALLLELDSPCLWNHLYSQYTSSSCLRDVVS